MSFNRNKIVPPKKIIISTNNNIQLQKSMKLYDKYGKRLANIQSNLNMICSQHDALMPLLSLLETMPQLSKSDQQLRLAAKRVGQIEMRLQKLHKTYNQSKNKQLLNNVQDSFGSVSKGLIECKQGVNNLQKKYISFQNNQNFSLSQTQSLTKQIQKKSEYHRKQIQNTVADFKNQMQIRYKRNIHLMKNTGNINNSNINMINKVNKINYSQLFPVSPFSNLQDQIKNLYRQIGMIQLELPENKLLEFHNYNFSRINYEFYEIQQIIDDIYNKNNEQQNTLQQKIFEAYKNLQKFKSRVKWLGYQIKGLRKKYLVQFNNMVDNNQNKNQYQQKFANDLRVLDAKHQNLTKKIQTLTNHYQLLVGDLTQRTDLDQNK